MMDAPTRQFSPRRIVALEAFVFRAPADPPVQTSFGIMRDRPAVLLRVRDDQGCEGWGEIWCNFPSVGAEHRARLVHAYGRMLIEDRVWEHPSDPWHAMQRSLRVLMLQTGEFGPLHQVMAGIDIAVWDLFSRSADVPLWQCLGGNAKRKEVPVYASGINPTEPEKLALEKKEEGFNDFKLKVGFGAERDLENLKRIREAVGEHANLMVDANQAWSMDEALIQGKSLADFGVLWLEEPLRADTGLADWLHLTQSLSVSIAAGENVYGEPELDALMHKGGIRIVQPDVGKWGGITGCLAVGQKATQAGKHYCPHWLGAGIGLTASLHLKAAVGGPGYVEVDSNPNPLRDLLCEPRHEVRAGHISLSDRPGLGVVPALDEARVYRVDL